MNTFTSGPNVLAFALFCGGVATGSSVPAAQPAFASGPNVRKDSTCTELRVVNPGSPGKGDARYERVRVACPVESVAQRSAHSTPIAKHCGERMLVKRGNPGQDRQTLQVVRIRCAPDATRQTSARDGSATDAVQRKMNLREAQRLVRRGDPGQGKDVFQTVLVDCPTGH